MREDPIVITGIARTAIGGFQGALAGVTAPQLGTAAVTAALEDSRLEAADVEEVFMGCVLPAGLGQAPARQAALGARLPPSVPCTTVNKMCGSGMQAAILAHDTILAGLATDVGGRRVIVAGGMESMTNAPYLLPTARGGQRMGHGEIRDHMFLDGLEDAYEPGRAMGTFAEDTAGEYGLSREAQDAFAITSLERAGRAAADGSFEREITPLSVTRRRETVEFKVDEQPGRARIDNIPRLRPAFAADGTVTAANSSSISDGAAAVVLMPRSEAERRGCKPLAVVHGHAAHARRPSQFTTAPVGAISDLLERCRWSAADVDLFEINEAFAVVTMVAMQELGLPHGKVNVHGGACALGHPIGASGARLIVTLLAALEKYDLRRGVAALCIGGGEATAMAIERPS